MSDPSAEGLALMAQPTSSGVPLYVTDRAGLPETLTFQNLVWVAHTLIGTIGPVAVHPRGCGTCEKAIDKARFLGVEVPPLYSGEVDTTP